MKKRPKTKRVSLLNRNDKTVLKIRRPVRISHHKHTGRHLPIQYTSYAVLFFIIALTGLTLIFTKQRIVEAGPPQSLSGNIQLSGVVPGPPPGTPATITSPVNNQHFSSSIITVSGSCTPGLFVELWRNNASASSAICNAGGGFELQVSLIVGGNQLKARISDALGQYGPDSTTITVFYDVPSVEAIISESDERLTTQQAGQIRDSIINKPLLLFTLPVHSGFYIGGKTKIHYDVNGGSPPYAVSVDWGDESKSSVDSKVKAGDYTASHIYKKAGQFQVTILVEDQLGNQSTVQTVLIVNGDKTGVIGSIQNACEANSTAPNCPVQNQLLQHIDNQAVPAVIGAALMATSFWLGEKVVYVRMASRLKRY